MAAYIESHSTVIGHWKTKRLARSLGICRAQAIGHLHALWHWAVDYAPDGDTSRHPPDVIADAALWEGDPYRFVEAMIDSEFFDPPGDIHDWFEGAGKLVLARRKDAERKRISRASGGSPKDVQRTAVGVRPESGLKSRAEQSNEEQKTNGRAPRSNQDGDPLFERFWSAYPRKVAVGAARKAWAALRPDPELAEAIIAGAERYRAATAATEPKFVAHGATWLRAERWRDEAEPSARPKLSDREAAVRRGAIERPAEETAAGMAALQARWHHTPRQPEA